MKPVNQVLSYAKQHPYVSLTVAGGLFATTAFGLYKLQDHKVDISSNRWKIDPAHDAQIRVGNITSKEGNTNMQAKGKSPSVQAGDVTSGKDTNIRAEQAEKSTPQLRK